MLGFVLAIVLTYLITRPIKNLLIATTRIGEGDFSSRARVFWNDEIGRFAAAFNHMAENLQKFSREVEEKEATRQALLEKLIFIQEQERRRIAHSIVDKSSSALNA
jgi:nitrogen fixation/metabolism regulation signal transduction histidine kinase